MQLGIQNLFGDLPDHPPSDSEDSFCSCCSECLKQAKAVKSKSTFKPHGKLCKTNLQNFSTNPTSQIIRAVSSARNLKHLKYYQMTKAHPSDQIIDRNLERLKFEARKQDVDEKYGKIMRQKSTKLHEKNQKKRTVGLKKKEMDLKQQQRQMQKDAFMMLREQKAQYLKQLQTKIFNLEKEKLIEGKRNFKEQLQANEKVAIQQLQSLQTTNFNQIRELKEKLQELKYIKRVNKVDQKKVLHHLQQQLKMQQQELNSNFVAEMNNYVQRSKLSRNR